MIYDLAGVAQWIERQPATERSLVLVPVRAHAWVAGQVTGWGHERGNRSMFLLHTDPSLPFSPL